MKVRLSSCSVDADTRIVEYHEGGTTRLTGKEAALFRYLLEHDGVASHDELLQEVWGYARGVRSKTVYTTLGRLREKVEADPRKPLHLLSEAGKGYELVGVAGQERAEIAETVLPPVPAPRRLIGREALAGELENTDVRLVAVCGLGGIGKTALVAEVARRWDHAGRRVLWVTGDDPEAAIRQALSADWEGMLAALGAVTIVLDGGADHALLARLLGFPSVRVVTIANAPAGHVDEVVFTVPPLEGDSAVELLLARAGLSDAQRQAAAELVERLGGIPLAIEVAARQVRSLSLQAVLASIEVGLALGGTPVHRALDASWDDTPEVLQQRLVALAASGPCDVASLAVFWGVAELEALQQLSDLARLGWVRPQGARFCVDEPLAAYVLSRGGPDDVAVQRITEHLSHEIATIPAHRLAFDIDAFVDRRPLLELAAEAGLGDHSARAALALSALDDRLGAWTSAEAWLQQAEVQAVDEALRRSVRASMALLDGKRVGGTTELARCREEAAGETGWVVRLDLGIAAVHEATGALDEARATLEGARAGVEQLGDKLLEALVDLQLGNLAWASDTEAAPHLRRASRTLRRQGHATLAARALSMLGGVLHAQGQLEEARSVLEEAVGVLRADGALLALAEARVSLGTLLASMGPSEEGVALLDQGIEVLQAADMARLPIALLNRAQALTELDRHEAALTDVLASRECGVDNPRAEAFAQLIEATVAAKRHLPDAPAHYERAIRSFRHADDRRAWVAAGCLAVFTEGRQLRFPGPKNLRMAGFIAAMEQAQSMPEAQRGAFVVARLEQAELENGVPLLSLSPFFRCALRALWAAQK